MDEIKATKPERVRIESAECPYCRKSYILPLYIDAETYGEASEWAAQHCDCDDAKRKRLLDKADERIKTLFKEYDEDVKSLLNVAMNYVWGGTRWSPSRSGWTATPTPRSAKTARVC